MGTPAQRSCTPTTCTTTTGGLSAVTLNGVTLPSWITWTINIRNLIQIWPQTGALIASNPYLITGTWSPDVGQPVSYTIYQVTVTCEVTTFTVSNTPAPQTYNLYDKSTVVDLSVLTWTQVPACGYSYTSSYSYTGLTSTII